MTRLTFKTKPEDTTWSDLASMWEEGERIEQFDGGWLYNNGRSGCGGGELTATFAGAGRDRLVRPASTHPSDWILS